MQNKHEVTSKIKEKQKVCALETLHRIGQHDSKIKRILN
jgi:hypothetical protein